MRKSIKLILLITLFKLLVPGFIDGQVRLPAIISDHMILQRDVEIKLWGWASKGEKVSISFMGKRHTTRTGSEGRWELLLPPMAAGGPYDMKIIASNTLQIKDILIGDVWLCSGQSNMEHFFARYKDRYAREIAESENRMIRQFLVPAAANLPGPAEDLAGASWKSANPENLMEFSVVGYFFAQTLYEKYKVPVGFINASVGGTPIEAWTSEEGLREFPQEMELISRNRDMAYVNSTNRAAALSQKEWEKEVPADKGLLGPVMWYETGYSPINWYPIQLPGYWEDQGVRELDGVVWYRRKIEIPANMTGGPAKVLLGRIVDADELYINGVPVGATSYQYPQRRYELAPGVLREGENLLVVRVTNHGGKGGFVPDKPYLVVAGEDTLNLEGKWLYKVGSVFPGNQPANRAISPRLQPTALYNGMLAPVTGYKVKGFCWYQGESNTGNPFIYRDYLKAMILDWRRLWNQDDLPFLIVQLPNFMEVNYSPEESNWAMLRESQLRALEVPHTAMAVTIDLGEWNDVHPGNKKPVGERLALCAMNLAYGDTGIISSGPLYKASTIQGDQIILEFDHVGSGLVSGNGEEPGHFSIAGEDKKFKWAKAEIKGNTVVVWNEEIPVPKFVRYAWADNPRFANLYNKEGLPASPFRTDK
jgi:sialate O-acetylesterase